MSAPLSEDVFHLAAPATEWPLSFIRFPNLPARPWRPVAPSSRRVAGFPAGLITPRFSTSLAGRRPRKFFNRDEPFERSARL